MFSNGKRRDGDHAHFSTEASNQTDHCNAGMLSPGAISVVLVRFSNPLASEAGNLTSAVP